MVSFIKILMDLTLSLQVCITCNMLLLLFAGVTPTMSRCLKNFLLRVELWISYQKQNCQERHGELEFGQIPSAVCTTLKSVVGNIVLQMNISHLSYNLVVNSFCVFHCYFKIHL